MDPDMDNDGLTDGTELGVTQPVPYNGQFSKGTSVIAKMIGTNRLNFTADVDPTTKTNVSRNDTDRDGMFDGFNDTNGNAKWDTGEWGEDINHDGNRDSTEADPFDYDTDDDGVPDGYTKNGVPYEGNLDSDNDGTINALEPDSDNDYLYDGLELSISPSMLSMDTDLTKKYYVIDNNSRFSTDPTDADTDDDGIIDGIEDKDHDGEIDDDTDMDYQLDEDEFWFETNPLSNDTDGDGLLDGEEDINHNGQFDVGETNASMTDTDSDSINDGEELVEGEDGYITDPNDFDSDDDGLSDGQEFEGWSVGICYQATGEMIGEPWNVTSDPNNNDTDGDGQTDFQEFMNGSDPNNTDTDGDTISDNEENLDGNIDNSPIGYDGAAPSIIIDINTIKIGWFTYHMEIKVKSKDNAGVDFVKIDIKNVKSTIWNLYGEKEKEVQTSFKIDWLKSIRTGYKIQTITCDINGNEGNAFKKVPSLLERINNYALKIISIYNKIIKETSAKFGEFIQKIKPWLDLFNPLDPNAGPWWGDDDHDGVLNWGDYDGHKGKELWVEADIMGFKWSYGKEKDLKFYKNALKDIKNAWNCLGVTINIWIDDIIDYRDEWYFLDDGEADDIYKSYFDNIEQEKPDYTGIWKYYCILALRDGASSTGFYHGITVMGRGFMGGTTFRIYMGYIRTASFHWDYSMSRLQASTFLHELGHSLYLDHCWNILCVMTPGFLGINFCKGCASKIRFKE
jgi:hypothetical protein